MSRLSKVLKISGVFLGVGVLICGISVFYLARLFSGEDKSERHVAHVDWLPKAASDITYIKNDGGLFYLLTFECTMPRAAFEAFAKEHDWKIEERKDFSVSGLRFGLSLPPVRATSTGDVYPTALVYEYRKANGGGITVAYDIELNRLFVHESSN